MRRVLSGLLIPYLFLISCAVETTEKEEAPVSDEVLQAKAKELSKKFIITDGHIDLPYRLKQNNFNVTTDKNDILTVEKGDFDYECCKAGGLDAPFISIYTPARYQETGVAKELADTLIRLVENISNAFPNKYTNVQRVTDNIDHVVKLAGIDHVGLESDFDGVGDSLPKGLKDVAQYPNLIYELLKRGYSDEDIEKIDYKNVFRVWNAVEQVAKGQQSSGT